MRPWLTRTRWSVSYTFSNTADTGARHTLQQDHTKQAGENPRQGHRPHPAGVATGGKTGGAGGVEAFSAVVARVVDAVYRLRMQDQHAEGYTRQATCVVQFRWSRSDSTRVNMVADSGLRLPPIRSLPERISHCDSTGGPLRRCFREPARERDAAIPIPERCNGQLDRTSTVSSAVKPVTRKARTTVVVFRRPKGTHSITRVPR